MLYLICDKCKRIITKYSESPAELVGSDSFIKCPFYDCGGDMFLLDEFIVPTIRELNAKGYETVHSCSAHLDCKRMAFNPYVVIRLPDDDQEYYPALMETLHSALIDMTAEVTGETVTDSDKYIKLDSSYVNQNDFSLGFLMQPIEEGTSLLNNTNSFSYRISEYTSVYYLYNVIDRMHIIALMSEIFLRWAREIPPYAFCIECLKDDIDPRHPTT